MASFSPRTWLTRLSLLRGRDLWERDLNDFGWPRRAAITALRIVVAVRRGVTRHQLATRAGSLTYVTIFSLVPTLAVAFAMFSAFGGMQNARDMLLSHIMDYLAVGVREQVTTGIDRMLHNINGGAIGATGFVFVIFSVFTLLSSVEDAFNDIWGVKRTRSYLERLTLYWTVVSISPTLIVVGLSLPALVDQVLPLRWMLEQTGTGDVFFALLMPWAFVTLGFMLLYSLMVSRRMPISAATVGGLAGGSLWFGAAHAYAWYARSTVYYASIYGSLAAIPVFVFWMYLSWLLVLIGAEVAFAWQNLETIREEFLAVGMGPAARQQMALRILTDVARRFVHGLAPVRVDEIPQSVQTSARAVNDIVSELVALGFLVEFGDDRLIIACDPRALTPGHVLHRLRHDDNGDAAPDSDVLMHRIHTHYRRAMDAADNSWNDLTLADLADGSHAANDDTGGGHRSSSRRR